MIELLVFLALVAVAFWIVANVWVLLCEELGGGTVVLTVVSILLAYVLYTYGWAAVEFIGVFLACCGVSMAGSWLCRRHEDRQLYKELMKDDEVKEVF